MALRNDFLCPYNLQLFIDIDAGMSQRQSNQSGDEGLLCNTVPQELLPLRYTGK